MGIKLYGTLPSPPSHSARLMLESKGLGYKEVWLLPGLHPALLRTRGFRGGTVPAIKIDGRKIQESRAISRALEELKPDPPLFPADPEQRLAVEEAERWGDEMLQDVPRRIVRWLVGAPARDAHDDRPRDRRPAAPLRRLDQRPHRPPHGEQGGQRRRDPERDLAGAGCAGRRRRADRQGRDRRRATERRRLPDRDVGARAADRPGSGRRHRGTPGGRLGDAADP